MTLHTMTPAKVRALVTNDEGHNSPRVAAPNSNQHQHANRSQKVVPLQVPQPVMDSDISIFRRLSRQFAQLGLSLYPLGGQTVLVSSHKLGMSKTLPDLRAAQIYLRQITEVVQ